VDGGDDVERGALVHGMADALLDEVEEVAVSDVAQTRRIHAFWADGKVVAG